MSKRRIAALGTLVVAGGAAWLLGQNALTGRAVGSIGREGKLSERPGLPKDIADVTLTKADAIASIEVIDQRVELNEQGLRVTISEARVTECHTGGCPDVMVVEQLGGEKDGIGLAVAGSTALKVGDSIAVATQARGARWRLVGNDKGVLLDLKQATPDAKRELDAKIRQLRP